MKDYKNQIAELIAEEIEDISAKEIRDAIEVPPEKEMGDYAFPCFKLARVLRKAPPVIAKDLTEKIRDNELFERVESVNAYVNMYLLRDGYIKDVLADAVKQGSDYGRSDIGDNKKIIVEYSSPNIAKPFHIGHIRSQRF